MQNIRLTYSSVEMNQIRFMNILKLLKRRGVIKDVDKMYKDNKPDSLINTIFKLKSDIDDTKIAINLISNTITSIPKNSSIDDFLSQNVKTIKILCVPTISKKIYKQVNVYPNSQVFELLNFDEDVPSKDFIHEQRILSEEEAELVKKQYKVKNLPKIQDCDFMARYYDAQIGQIMEIQRSNINCGIGIAYRIVVPGKIELFF
tara:strand:- start:2133 stop:2741 length:609 start_codon:yes stop_codon:yes gene_type:complete